MTTPPPAGHPRSPAPSFLRRETGPSGDQHSQAPGLQPVAGGPELPFGAAGWRLVREGLWKPSLLLCPLPACPPFLSSFVLLSSHSHAAPLILLRRFYSVVLPLRQPLLLLADSPARFFTGNASSRLFPSIFSSSFASSSSQRRLHIFRGLCAYVLSF